MAKKEPKTEPLRQGPYRLPTKPDGLKQITKWQ